MYTARVEHVGSELRVTLSGSNFLGSGTFTGVVLAGGEITFTIRPEFVWDYDAFDLVERLGDGTEIIVSGNIAATRTGAGIFGTGDLGFPTGNAGEIRTNSTQSVWCAIDHFDLTPR
jgi:hypothetical protein